MDLVNHLNDRLLFAIPKKGRLQQRALDLLEGSDIQFRRDNRLDIALVKNLPLALVFLPAADIPTFVGEGRVDLGITGRDQVAEHEAGSSPTETTGVVEVMDLGFGKCKLQVQVPEKGTIKDSRQLIGKNIVTSFTTLTREYFRKLEAEEEASQVNGTSPHQLRTKIKYVGGSVEAACALGVADGIVDLVESGETMRAAGLMAIDTVIESTAVLITSRKPSNPDLVNLIAARIRGVIDAQRYVLITYNVRQPALEAVCSITPGKRAPTINRLVGLRDFGVSHKQANASVDGAVEPSVEWLAVSAMVARDEAAGAMDRLTQAGAEDILVTKLENTRTR